MSYEETIQKTIDEHKDELIGLASNIWENPEMGWHETKAVNWTAEVLKNNGFDVEIGAYSMPTAIRATWGSGHPVVGFTGEYDCLPGLSQDHVSYRKPIVENGIGHGCGHNLLGTGVVGAVIGLKAAMEESKLPGTIIFYGTPAEEQMTGKGFMARNGAFKECDFSYTWHPSTYSTDSIGTYTGVIGAYFEFHGRTAHAAGMPENGRSALDAAQLMNMGVEFLREHVTNDVRIHYIFTDGGMAPNIVPDHAETKYFVRAMTMESVRDTFNRVVKCAEGAATMTETTTSYRLMGGIYPTLQNKVLAQAVQEARQIVPLNTYTEEELKFADEINLHAPGYEKGKTVPISNQDQRLLDYDVYGSTDYGDVEHICPGFQVVETTAATLTPGHSWMNTACVGSSIGQKGMIRAAKLMAIAAYKIMSDPARLEAAKKEFAEEMHGSVYECPIDDTVEWPYKD